MAQKGFSYSPFEIIQKLRQTLQSGYDPESIPRELTQNADDARAEGLHIGWTPGLAPGNTSNPLLEDPALFAVNDGPFTDEHARAIRRVGISSKSGDEGTIGKFGLGLKSVFGVCEAFFYFAGEDPLQPRVHDLINPWSDTGLPGVQAWDRFELPDARGLLRRLEPVVGGLCRYFVLWIPLRTQARHGGGNHIHGEWFDDTTGPPASLFKELGPRFASFLPLLHSVRNVKVWTLGKQPEVRFAVNFRDNDGRCPRPDKMEEEQRVPAKGSMLLANGDSAGDMVPYVALTADLRKRASDLRKLTHLWPTTYRIRGEKEEPVPEDNPAHAGVCWQRWPMPAGQGRLRWRWAAFLPLRQEWRSLPLTEEDGGFEYLLTLHAAGFVNPGRTDFLPGEYCVLPTNQEELYRAWNHTLCHKGTLPLLPESLMAFREQAALTDAAVRSLVRAIASQEFLHPLGYREAVCSEHQLVYRWTAEGAGWKHVQSSAGLLEIPDPAGQDVVGTLPLLQDLSGRDDLYLVLEDWPRLARAAAGWPTDLLCAALESAVVEGDGLEYLARFVRSAVSPDPSANVVDALVGLVRRILAAGISGGRALHLREIANRLPPERVLCLPLPQSPDGACPFLRSLLNADGARRLVPLPGSLSLHGRAAPTVAESVALLGAIHEKHNSDPGDPRSEIALAVLRACPVGVLPEVLDRCQRLLLFHGHEIKDATTRDRTLSLVDLREARDGGTLFTDDRPSLAEELSLATGASVLLAPRAVVALVCTAPAPCSVPACASLLSRWEGPDLRGPDARIPLLEALASHSLLGESFSENRLAVRLLLHGCAAHLRSGEPLLCDRHGTGLWGRLVRTALGRDDQWRLIDPALAARIPQHRARDYSLQEVGPRTAEDELRRLGPELLAQGQFELTRQDAAELLRCVQDADVLRALPIHEDAASGALRRIGPECYWEGGVDLPPGLPAPPVLLRRSANVAERAIQDTLVRPIGHADAIRILLNQPEPHRYWRPILSSFYSLGRAVPHEVLGVLRSASWLPGPNGPVAPGSVLHLPQLADVLASMPLDLFQGLVPSSRLLEAGEHQGLQSLADHRLVPPQEEALGLLGEALAEDDHYHVGHGSTFLTDDAQGHSDLNRFLQAFGGVPDDVMATYPLAAAIDRTIGRGLCVRVFLSRLKRRLPQERVLRILDFLRRRHEQGGPREHIERAYLWYLGMVKGLSEELFPDGLRLLSEAKTWRPPADLCVGTEAISPEWRIDKQQRDLLRPQQGTRQPPAPPSSSAGGPAVAQGDALQRELNDSVGRLRGYFDEWERARPYLRPAIGGFLLEELRGAADARRGGPPGGTARRRCYHPRGNQDHEGDASARRPVCRAAGAAVYRVQGDSDRGAGGAGPSARRGLRRIHQRGRGGAGGAGPIRWSRSSGGISTASWSGSRRPCPASWTRPRTSCNSSWG